MIPRHEPHPPQPSVPHDHHGFHDAQAVAERLEAPERDVWQKPDEVIAALELPANATVVDIGSGTGYFVVRIAPHLEHGKVIGLDAEPAMVAWLSQRASDLGLVNVDARLLEAATEIPLSEPVDLLICVDTYHHIPDRVDFFAAFTAHLKPGGNLVVIDRPLNELDGPPTGHRLSEDQVVDELTRAGFSHVRSLDFLLPYQYYLEFSAI